MDRCWMGYRISMGIHTRGSTAIDAGFLEMLAQGGHSPNVEIMYVGFPQKAIALQAIPHDVP